MNVSVCGRCRHVRRVEQAHGWAGLDNSKASCISRVSEGAARHVTRTVRCDAEWLAIMFGSAVLHRPGTCLQDPCKEIVGSLFARAT